MDLLKNIFKGDKVIWIIFLMLCLISVVEVFSASSTLMYKSGNHWDPITRHGTFLLFGAVLVVLFHHIPYKWFQVFPAFMLPVSGIMLVVAMFMTRINDAGRWIDIMGIRFQPSELAKMAVIIVTASILSKGQNEDGASPKAFKHILWITVPFCLAILPENFSTAALLSGVVFLMMYIGRVAIRKLLMVIGCCASLAVAVVLFLETTKGSDIEFLHRFDTWRARLENFVKNEKVPAAKFDIDKNGQVGHANIAIATSHIIGKGPGNSVQRDFLSQAYSDFIFAIIIEELGLVGGIVVVFLYVCLLIRVGRIARKCDRSFPAFLVIGIGLILVSQALFNMMVAVGLAPVTGQPLPLISRGGTSTLINCIYIGMILSVSRYTARLEEIHALQEAGQAAPLPSTGGSNETKDDDALPYVTDSQAQTAEEPTARMLNNDSEFE